MNPKKAKLSNPKKLFLDANILITVLNKEYPLFTNAARILSLAERDDFTLFTSPLCLAITFYFVEKKSSTTIARQKVEVLVKHFKITMADTNTVEKTLSNPNIIDFEDGLEYYSSLNSDCQVIITENTSDFYFSEIPVLNCKDYIESYLIEDRR